MFSHAAQSIVLILAVAALMLAGCDEPSAPAASATETVSIATSAAAPRAAAAPAPMAIPVPTPDQSRSQFQTGAITGRELIRYLIAIDNSSSSMNGRNRRATLEELEPCFARLLRTGGEIELVEIRDSAGRVHRLRLPPPPIAPTSSGSDQQPTVFDQAIDQAQAQASQQQYDADSNAWLATQRQRIDAFRSEAGEVFNPVSASARTLFGPVFRQADAYFSEPGWGAYVPVLIFVTDGEDTGSNPADLQLQWSRPNIAVVNDSGNLESLGRFRALRFTSLAQAITFFDSPNGGGQ